MNNRPNFLKNTKRKICLICEGYEEYDYISRLLELGVWSDAYDFALVNAQSCGNISARYQDRYQSDSYDIVLVLCDTDKKPHKNFETIKTKINDIFGKQSASDEVVIFVNPYTIQVILSHFDVVQLQTQSKSTNAKIIENLTGVQRYKASEKQRKKMCGLITKENYSKMRENIKSLSNDYTVVGSTNFTIFFERFESSDDSWIREINSKLEST